MPITTSMSVKPINNAGILKTPNTRTEAGREVRFDMNTVRRHSALNGQSPAIARRDPELGALVKPETMNYSTRGLSK